ncbi:hypothetical protein L7F22_013707 [Adiantum nelumboides]|nr:hypothetical protein [Adiantum nelumboides]
MALHEALSNGLVSQPVFQQNPASPLKGLGTSKAAATTPLLLSTGNVNLQGMQTKTLTCSGRGGFPTYATTVGGGIETLFRPSTSLLIGQNYFPYPIINPLWINEGENLQNLYLHPNDKVLADSAEERAKTTAGIGTEVHGAWQDSKLPSKQENLHFGDDNLHGDFPQEQDGITIPYRDLEYWQSQLKQKVVIGLCHGIRPSLEALKTWANQQWLGRNYKLDQVQYLPNNYYLFFFDDAESAFQVISQGQWIIKNTPLFVFSWFLGFNPRDPKPTKVPVWVEFPHLPIEFYPWMKQLGSCLGRVLGQRARRGFNPKWDPLIEVDVNKDLKCEVPIKDLAGNVLHAQKISYKNLPNTYFQCLKQGHHIKDCPELKPAPPPTTNEPPPKNEGFQFLTRKNSARGGKFSKQGKNEAILSPLLENVFVPFSEGTQVSDEEEQLHDLIFEMANE